MRVLREMQKGLPEKGAVMPAEHMKINREVPEFVISEEDLSVLLTLPAVGWAGEHPDFEREQVDNRYV